MLGVSHVIINIALVQTYASTTGAFVHPACYLATTIGSIFPDRIEKIFGARWIKHRTITHTLSYWLAIIPVGWIIVTHLDKQLLLPFMHPKYAIMVSQLWLWFAFGVLMHLAEDALTMSGIPITPSKKIALKWFKAGAWQEKIMAAIATGIYGWLIYNS